MRGSNTRKKVLFSSLTILLFFGILEIGLRVSGFEFDMLSAWIDRSNQTLSSDGWFAAQRQNLPDIAPEDTRWFLEYDEELLWKTRSPNPYYNITEQGFRGEPFPETPVENEYRILILGDSCAWGYGVGYYDSFAYLLENSLNIARKDVRFRIINAAIPGYSTAQGRLYFETRLEQIQPDLVILYFGRNDSRIKPGRWNGRTDAMLLREKHQKQPLMTCIRSLRIYEGAAWLLEKFRHAVDQQTGKDEMDEEIVYMHRERILEDNRKRVPGHEFIKNIVEIAALAKKRSADTLLLTIPVNPSIVGNYNEELRKISRDNGLPLVDLAAYFDEKNQYGKLLFDECHPSERGHKFIAEILYAYFRDKPTIF